MFTKVETLVTQYELPKSVAREIIADETQTALRTRWQVWLWVVVAVAPAVWFFFQPHAGGRLAAFWILLAACVIWFALGSYFATTSIHAAAKAKAERIAGKHL
jgi:thiol:disulfide interchange protein